MVTIAERNMSLSATYFRDQVWPLFGERLGGRELIPVESVTDSEFAKLLDTQAGIDGWQIVAAGGIRGIASRVQVGTCWRSWTIRTQTRNGGRTERDKLLEVDLTLLRPSYHIQAYTESLQLPPTGAACIRTADLIRLLLATSNEEKTNPQDGNRFVPLWWRDALDEGYQVWTVGITERLW